MNILRKVLIPAAAALALMGPATVLAQQQAPTQAAAPAGQWQGHEHGRGMMRMFQSLNLSDQQKMQIRQIMQQFRQSHTSGTPPTAQERDQLHQQIMNVLTPSQRTQFQQKLEQMREQHGDRDGVPSSPQP